MDQLFEPPEPAPSAPPGPEAPLAARLRPQALADVVGQGHLLHDGAPLRAAIEEGRPHSMLLHGPPGTGKTTLARLLAGAGGMAFEELSAVEAGKAEVRAVLERAVERRRGGRGTVLFLDEIHRFNKAQQDALLPAVEDGTITLVGATTENPYFSVNGALLSRCSVYELRALEPADVAELLRRGARELGASVDDDALEFLARRSGGDARTALAALELAGERVDLARAEEALQQRAVRFDRDGDRHFDTISAWIKSTRGSDVDASLYYLAVMLEGGEDPRFIARRMVVLASEDIGLADPHALPLAVAAAAAVDRVGMPEAHYPLAHAAAYLARAPKSAASGRGLHAARAYVREHGAQPPPGELRSGPLSEPGYVSPHDDAEAAAARPLLPEAVRGRRFLPPVD